MRLDSGDLLELSRGHRAEIEALPPALLELDAAPPYPVERSPVLVERQRTATLRKTEVRRREGLAPGP